MTIDQLRELLERHDADIARCVQHDDFLYANFWIDPPEKANRIAAVLQSEDLDFELTQQIEGGGQQWFLEIELADSWLDDDLRIWRDD